MKTIDFRLIFLLLVSALMACTENPVPKPRGYFRMSFPENNTNYSIQFTPLPLNTRFTAISSVKKKGRIRGNGISISFPDYKAKIHLSYKDISGNLNQLTEDARTLAYKHTYKADAIDEQVLSILNKRFTAYFTILKGTRRAQYNSMLPIHLSITCVVRFTSGVNPTRIHYFLLCFSTGLSSLTLISLEGLSFSSVVA